MTPSFEDCGKEASGTPSHDGPCTPSARTDALHMDRLQWPPDAGSSWMIDFFAMSPGVLVDDNFLSRGTGVAVSTIRNWRSGNKGPRPIRLGGLVRYRVRDVTAWLDSCSKGAATGTGERS